MLAPALMDGGPLPSNNDVFCMSQMYGDWKGLSPPEGEVFISHVPPEGMVEDEPDPAPSSGVIQPVVAPAPLVPIPAQAQLLRAVQALQTHNNPVVVNSMNCHGLKVH